MSDKANSMMKLSINVWWAALVEGIILLGVGIYTLANPQVVGPWILLLVSIYLLVDGVQVIYANMRADTHTASRSYQLASGGIGVITGLFILVFSLVGDINLSAARMIFAVGLLLSGTVFLVGLVATNDKAGVGGKDIAANLLKVLLAVLFLITPSGVNLQLIGIVAAFFGVVLIVYAIILLRHRIKNRQ